MRALEARPIKPKGFIHDLKVWPVFFEPIASGRKTYEIRKLDRDYQTGDLLKLREWDKRIADYTGRELTAVITFISSNPDYMREGFGVLGIKLVNDESAQQYLKMVQEDSWLWMEDALVKAHVESMVRICRDLDSQVQTDKFFRLFLRKKLDLILHRIEPALKREIDQILEAFGEIEQSEAK